MPWRTSQLRLRGQGTRDSKVGWGTCRAAHGPRTVRAADRRPDSHCGRVRRRQHRQLLAERHLASADRAARQPRHQDHGDYAAVINDLLAFDQQVALASGDQELNRTVRAMNEVSAIEQEYSSHRAIVMYALTSGHFALLMPETFTTSLANLQADRNLFETFASSARVHWRLG